jgi:hypothetical protein
LEGNGVTPIRNPQLDRVEWLEFYPLCTFLSKGIIAVRGGAPLQIYLKYKNDYFYSIKLIVSENKIV